jgi:hypothetical protein
MKPKVILFSFFVGLTILLSFSVIAIAEQPIKLPAIQTPTNEAAGQINESENDTTNPAAELPEETNSGSSYSIELDPIPDWRFEWFGEDSDEGYEIRRDKNVWDYYYCDNAKCEGNYLTNLPEPHNHDYSEEYDLPWCCYYLPHVPLGDEEFEIKCYSPNALEVDKWYYVYAELSIKSEEKGSTLYVQTQSEYCGKLPGCNAGFKYGWCDMTRNTVTT